MGKLAWPEVQVARENKAIERQRQSKQTRSSILRAYLDQGKQWGASSGIWIVYAQYMHIFTDCIWTRTLSTFQLIELGLYRD